MSHRQEKTNLQRRRNEEKKHMVGKLFIEKTLKAAAEEIADSRDQAKMLEAKFK